MIIMPSRSRFPRVLLLLAAAVFFAASTLIPQADPSRCLNDVKSLASPNMEGRGAGTKGLTRAQHLIEKRYQSLGLEPAGVNASYLQPFTVITGAQLKGKNELVLLTGEHKHALKSKQDFVPFSFSSSG